MNKKFIMTQDADTAAELTASGYTLLNNQDGTWFFLNNGRLSFEQKEYVVFTDMFYG